MLKNAFIYFFLVVFGMIKVANGQKLAVQNFYFDTDSSTLSVAQINEFNQFLKEIDTVKINSVSILGYTDDIGRKGYNDTLSTKRATAIKNMLVAHEIKSTSIETTLGKGKLFLAGNISIEKQRENNRKVEVVINYTLITKAAQEKTIYLDSLKVGDKIVLENVLFESSRHQFLQESYPTLEMLTRTLKQKTKYNVAILGHICCTPPGKDIKDFDTGEYNLSYARAKVVYEYLVKNGIDPKRLSYAGMMGNYPLGKGDKFDRRVELQITSINP